MDAKALLGRQMASIADTLAKASLRRDVEVKKRSTPSIAPAAAPSIMSGTGSSGPGGVVAFAGRHSKPHTDALGFGRIDLEQEGANNVMGWIWSTARVQEPLTDCETDRTASRETPRDDGGDSDGARNICRHSENNADARHPDRADPVADSYEMNDRKATLAELEHARRTNGAHAEKIGNDFDPKCMLAELDKNSIRGEDANTDPQEPLRDSQGRTSSTQEVVVRSTQDEVYETALDMTVETSSADDNDPRRMLAEIENLSNNDPKKMLAELECTSSAANFSKTDGDDLVALRAGLTNWLSPLDDQQLPTVESLHAKLSSNQDEVAPVCPKELIPYVIALELEMSGQEWEKALFWTEYIFGSGSNSHKAEQERAAVIAQAEKELNALIEYTLQEEDNYQRAENIRRLHRRVIVSNIATAAGVGDLKEFFYGFHNLM
jgi:hypothetical protein